MPTLTIRSVPILALGFLLAAALSAAQGEGRPVQVIEGLDGASYLAYKPALVKKVQEALKATGLYNGEIHGDLDQATKKALAEFQKQHGLEACGVPTPRTRELLFSGEDRPPAT